MTLNDPLSNALSSIKNAEKVGKKECLAKPSSKLIESVLNILKKQNYIKDFKKIEGAGKTSIKILLTGKINKCAAIKPRYNVKLPDYEKFEKRYLPGKNIGILIISTSKGILDHKESKEKKLGGRLVAYCY